MTCVEWHACITCNAKSRSVASNHKLTVPCHTPFRPGLHYEQVLHTRGSTAGLLRVASLQRKTEEASSCASLSTCAGVVDSTPVGMHTQLALYTYSYTLVLYTCTSTVYKH